MILTLLVYASVLVSPDFLWVTGFISLGIPLLLIFHLFLLLIYIAQSKRLLIYPLVALVAGFPFIRATLAINPDNNEELANLEVLSFNARFFREYRDQIHGELSQNMMDWAINQEVQIICFQEYYSHPEYDELNTIKQFRQKGFEFYGLDFSEPDPFHGLAIFSKFPIIHQGTIPFAVETYNGAIYADLLMNEDTLRVYNLHLKSMGIEGDEVISPKIRDKYRSIASRFKNGVMERAREINDIYDHISVSPHPVVVCGDFNDVPYSYSYFKLKQDLNNAFEHGGNGFGFSFNGKLGFLRIDNQFFSDRIKIHGFKTMRNMPLSDHFPIKGYYSLEESKEL